MIAMLFERGLLISIMNILKTLLVSNSAEGPKLISHIVILFLLVISVYITILVVNHRKRHAKPLSDRLYDGIFLFTLIDLLPEPIYLKDDRGVILICNKALQNFLHLKKEDIIGKSVFEILTSEDAKTCVEKEKPLFDPKGTDCVTYESVRIINGKKHYVIERKRAISDQKGEILGIIGIIIDITELKKAQEKLIAEENRLKLALEIGSIAYMELDMKTNEIYISDTLLQLLGYESTVYLGYLDKFVNLIHPDDREHFISGLYTCLVRNAIIVLQFRIKKPNDEYIWLEWKARPIEKDFDSGEPAKIAAVMVDITGYKSKVLRQEQIISDLYVVATTDSLTGALVRWAGEAYIKRILDKTNNGGLNQEPGCPFSLIMIDLDNFKLINDTYGHLMGDAILSKIGETIKKSLRKNDIFVRWGGDEFLIFCQNSIDQTIPMAERLKHIIKEAFFMEEISPTVSIGLTHANPGESLDEIFKRADEALYKAKKEGKNRICIVS